MRHPNNLPKATIDFESRSECSLRNCGSWRYSLDPTTEVLCMAFRLPHWAPGRTGLWHPGFPSLGITESQFGGPRAWNDLAELFAWIRQGGLIESHNAWMERGIWTNILQPMGWPSIAPTQWRCSAAKAAAFALPRALDDAAAALALPIQKDIDGAKVMKRLVKPRKANRADHLAWGRRYAPCRMCAATGKVPAFKKDGTPAKREAKCERCVGLGYLQNTTLPPMPTLYLENLELFVILCDYCRTDVLAEEGISHRLPDLNAHETEMYLLDQTVNERGFQIDAKAVETALTLIDQESEGLNAELRVLTGGQVEKATQRDKMLAWLESEGLTLTDSRAGTLDEVLELSEEDDDLPPWVQVPNAKARRGIELIRMLGRSSTAKYLKMRDWMSPADHRVRGGLLYHGASTGRWSGSGVQPHNFPKGGIKDMEHVWRVLMTLDRQAIAAFPKDKAGTPYGNVMEVLSHALRGAIVAGPGQQLYVADYAAIEARVLLWLAGADDALEVFRRNEDIYCYMADDIFGYPTNKDDHPKERGIGKIAVLGLGYQMGAAKFVDTCALGGVVIPEDLPCTVCGTYQATHWKEDPDHAHQTENNALTAVRIVRAYREKFWQVKELWADLEAAAIEAVQNPGDPQFCGRVTYRVRDGFLFCTLPSGRRLAYYDPKVEYRRTAWGKMKPTLTFMGVNSLNRQWQRQATYGGMLAENNTQAVARDLMADALLRCEQSGLYRPVLTVHDELIAEAPLGLGSVAEFEHLMAECPEWADGCPVAAEGWNGRRYKK